VARITHTIRISQEAATGLTRRMLDPRIYCGLGRPGNDGDCTLKLSRIFGPGSSLGYFGAVTTPA
jgi:hypothetical protein